MTSLSNSREIYHKTTQNINAISYFAHLKNMFALVSQAKTAFAYSELLEDISKTIFKLYELETGEKLEISEKPRYASLDHFLERDM